MKRYKWAGAPGGEGMKVVVARGAWGALLVSLGLAALGIIPGAAGAAVDLKETEAVCRTAFGDSGPHLRPTADAAPGQVMSVGITWKWDAWDGGQLTEILTRRGAFAAAAYRRSCTVGGRKAVLLAVAVAGCLGAMMLPAAGHVTVN